MLVRRAGPRASSRGRLSAVLGARRSSRSLPNRPTTRSPYATVSPGSPGRSDLHAGRGQLRLPRLAIVARSVPDLVLRGSRQAATRSWSTSIANVSIQRMRQYFDPDVSDQEMANLAPAAMAERSAFQRGETDESWSERLPAGAHRALLLPADGQPLALLGARGRSSWTGSARSTVPHVVRDNLWLSARQRNDGSVRPLPRTTGCSPTNIVDVQRHDVSDVPAPRRAGACPPSPRRRTSVATSSPLPSAYLEYVDGDEFELLCHVVGVLHAPRTGRERRRPPARLAARAAACVPRGLPRIGRPGA